MAAALKIKQAAKGPIDPSLPRGFLTRQPDDTDEIRDVWARYVADDNPRDFQRLTEFYMPMAHRRAMIIYRRNADLFSDVDDMIQDGVLGLMSIIRGQKRNLVTTPFFKFKRMSMAINRSIWHEAVKRRWGGESRQEKMKVVRSVRAQLTLAMGRTPDEAEMLHGLRAMITNPGIYVGDAHMIARSQLENPDERAKLRQYPDPTQSSPIEQLLDRETIALAMKDFSPSEQEMLKLLLDGHSKKQVGKLMGMPEETARRRMNGLLWTARCRAELADYVGVERSQHPPVRDSHLPPIDLMPPARRVAI